MTPETDDIPYLWTCNPGAHPNRFATTAILFGMNPSPVTHCRVLELGGGDGSNIIPMAFNLPDSEFVGIGLDEKEVKRGIEKINALQLKNIKLSYANLNDVTKDIGKFDYIIANGIYSWITPTERASVMRIIRDSLAPNGVAYINYNAYPGWHMQSMLREMLLYHIKGMSNQHEAVKHARAFLAFLSQVIPVENIQKDTQHWSDSDFYHQFLNKINQPFYFHEMADMASEVNLQYLAESEFHSMNPNNLPDPIRDAIRKFSKNIIETEQNMDFVRNRPFRETLLCHADVELNRNIDVSNIRQFYFSADTRHLQSDHSAVKSLLDCFSQQWPKPVNLGSILAGTHKSLGLPFNLAADQAAPSDASKTIVDTLWFYYQKGLLKTYMHPPLLTTDVSEYPEVSILTRYEADKQPWLANQLHEPVPVTPLWRRLLPLLDGRHDVDMLVGELGETKGKLLATLRELGVVGLLTK